MSNGKKEEHFNSLSENRGYSSLILYQNSTGDSWEGQTTRSLKLYRKPFCTALRGLDSARTVPDFGSSWHDLSARLMFSWEPSRRSSPRLHPVPSAPLPDFTATNRSPLEDHCLETGDRSKPWQYLYQAELTRLSKGTTFLQIRKTMTHSWGDGSNHNFTVITDYLKEHLTRV